MQSDKCSKHKGLSNISADSEDVAKYYDDWSGDYDETLTGWRYDAPEQVAAMLRAALPPDSVILDAGCGTGVSGRALRSAGFKTVDGVDISSESLKVSEASGAYRSLRLVNMQRFPLPIPDNQYDGLACVGVLTYLTDSKGVLKEFTRIVRPGGVVVFTQRSDLFIERNFESMLKGLLAEGAIKDLNISEPCPYLPDNEEFGDRILVHYITYRVV